MLAQFASINWSILNVITKKASLLAAAVGSLLFATGIISSANATVLSVTVWTGSPTGDIQSSQTADLGDKPAAANIDADVSV